MKRGVIKRGFILASLLGLSLVNLLGSSFLIYQQVTAAMGMGGAFIAMTNDPSALFYNAAGLAFLSGTQLSREKEISIFRINSLSLRFL